MFQCCAWLRNKLGSSIGNALVNCPALDTALCLDIWAVAEPSLAHAPEANAVPVLLTRGSTLVHWHNLQGPSIPSLPEAPIAQHTTAQHSTLQHRHRPQAQAHLGH